MLVINVANVFKKYWSPKFCLLRNRFVGLNAFRLAVPDFFFTDNELGFEIASQ